MKNFIYGLLIINLTITNNNKNSDTNVHNNHGLKSFCQSIPVDKYSSHIKILNKNNQLIIYNGDDKIGVFDEHTKKVFSILMEGDYDLMQIQNNKNYILLSYNIKDHKNNKDNNNLSCYYIINKNTGFVENFFCPHPIIGSYFLGEKYIIIVDLFNTITCYDYKKNIIWHHNSPYSKPINKNYENIIIDKYIYWACNDNLIYILNAEDGNIKESINISEKNIINIMLYGENLVVMTNYGPVIYDLYTSQLIKSVEKIYPTSKGVIYDDKLYFHNNKTLYQWNLKDFNLKEYKIKGSDEEFLLLNILNLDGVIIMASTVGNWYYLRNDKIHKISLWQFWTNIEPVIYDKYIIFYKNFSRQYFDFMNLKQLLDLK